MKCFVVTALIVLAAVFCISHVDGSRASEVKSIEKRQVPLLPVRNQTCSPTELQRRNDSLRCNNASVGQQLLDVFAECGHNNEALRKEQECGRNETGGFCYGLSDDTAVSDLVNLVARCFRRSRLDCDSSCNNSLQQLMNSTGCCANYLITNARQEQQLRGDPWSSCGLQPPDNCSSTLRFVQRPNRMICQQSDIAYRINRLFCNPSYITPFISIMRSCGRTHEESAQSMINGCGVNKYERFCFETETSQLVSDLRRDVQSRCFVNATTCPILCKIALDMYRTGADCCLNNLYNNTLSSTSASNLSTTSHVLWSFCEMSSPGFCRNTIDSSSAYSVLLQVSVAVTGLSAIIAVLV